MMQDEEEPDAPPSPWLRGLVFFGSALLFAAFLRATIARPWIGIVGAAVIAVALLLRWWAHARVRRLQRRADVIWDQCVRSLDERWLGDKKPHSDTLSQLLSATAFVAYGRIDDARKALAAAARGPAWEAALEHRLFLDTMLCTFEGDASQASAAAAHYASLPIPDNAASREHVAALRSAVAAFVRAFQHEARPGDLRSLVDAAELSPLVHWSMRYAAAIAAVDAGLVDEARRLIEGAPRWPEESAFRSFHDELSRALGRPPVTSG